MVRLTTKNLFFIILGCMGLVLLLFHKRCTIQHQLNMAAVEGVPPPVHQAPVPPVGPVLDNLTCVLNKEVGRNIGWKQQQHQTGDRRFQCKTDGVEVFVPFSWVRGQYEAKGELVGGHEFDISQSYSKVFTPKEKYDPAGPFMHFKSFSVEARSRVKCISASEGVPVSTQWSPAGYFYPTQIAQFALSHYSSHTATSIKVSRETVHLGDKVKMVLDKETNSEVMEFNERVEVPISSNNLMVCLDLKLSTEDSMFSIVVKAGEEDITLIYRLDREFVSVGKEGELVFGLSEDSKDRWIRVTRDVYTDVDKGLVLARKSRYKKSRIRISRLVFSGKGMMTNVTLSTSEHLRQFLHGANWFLRAQDSEGGWPSQITFNKESKKYPRAGEVLPGWYGAMCQGQAISVLVRGYLSTGQHHYLSAAQKALAPFTVSTADGGVMARVMENWVWYEEYPTQPASHILNGFMYALLGLYDLSQVDGGDHGEAGQLYIKGMESLQALLPLFDTGAGTFYDLRHFTMHTAPKGARWDYHSTHINQLLTLHSIQKSRGQRGDLLKETAERWRGYMMGIKSSHN